MSGSPFKGRLTTDHGRRASTQAGMSATPRREATSDKTVEKFSTRWLGGGINAHFPKIIFNHFSQHEGISENPMSVSPQALWDQFRWAQVERLSQTVTLLDQETQKWHRDVTL
ncbi:hypothetical protein [Rhizobium mesoamericanum]|uniref:hypothetical protein n=1 Tax=Rhizobium mesoamericanum TaxID=1079800 RepID=UPI0002E0FEF5|nr:hypothetical protein [Rhizobium mesoamericanum]